MSGQGSGRAGTCKTCVKVRRSASEGGDPLPPLTAVTDGKKRCSTCKILKSVEEFRALTRVKSGYLGACRSCEAARRRKYKYGVDGATYDRMFEEQRGLCAICDQPESQVGIHGSPMTLAADHCHETGRVRGLLCFRCNVSISSLEKSGLLERAVAYLSANG